MKSFVLIALALFGCHDSSPGADDVVGPFTGTTSRYVVDSFTLPGDDNAAQMDADDLAGDGTVLNQFGIMTGLLAYSNDLSTAGPAMIASGVIVSTVEILADDLSDDPTVQVTYFGSAGDLPTPMGGSLVHGVFMSNRTATTAVPGRASVVLPVFVDADPSVFRVDGLEMNLTSDGSGGFNGFVGGGIPEQLARDAAAAGIVQMIASYPTMHVRFADLVDTNHDGELSIDEVSSSSYLDAFLAPDLSLYDGGVYAPAPATDARPGDSLSIGFRIHLSPCPSGSCAPPQTDSCHDRVLDGTETAVDCGGGACQSCPGSAQCAVGDDCQTDACADGTCAPETCSDGVRDGFESDVDCGDGCGPCPIGELCNEDLDCVTDHCDDNGRCAVRTMRAQSR